MGEGDKSGDVDVVSGARWMRDTWLLRPLEQQQQGGRRRPLLCNHSAPTLRSQRFPRRRASAVARGTTLSTTRRRCTNHCCCCSPCAYRLALPVLYCVTFMVMCFLQPLQNAFLVLGTFTCLVVIV